MDALRRSAVIATSSTAFFWNIYIKLNKNQSLVPEAYIHSKEKCTKEIENKRRTETFVTEYHSLASDGKLINSRRYVSKQFQGRTHKSYLLLSPEIAHRLLKLDLTLTLEQILEQTEVKWYIRSRVCLEVAELHTEKNLITETIAEEAEKIKVKGRMIEEKEKRQKQEQLSANWMTFQEHFTHLGHPQKIPIQEIKAPIVSKKSSWKKWWSGQKNK
ncbi:hypothetical protein CHS0354_025128 [Potamilus streckersoni]|uniref:Uncharacterized protein n=1 Tax=Potamilus streckersoni TaxID=2493646 RepID=A0AAE0RWF8_9BIVA|nr:hypothetical protein CHS0354_025128 [Potamilus streckersoni]